MLSSPPKSDIIRFDKTKKRYYPKKINLTFNASGKDLMEIRDGYLKLAVKRNHTGESFLLTACSKYPSDCLKYCLLQTNSKNITLGQFTRKLEDAM